MNLRDRLHLERLQHSSAPILVGPWLSEVGFEVLYWLPFMAYLRKRYKLDKDRLIAVSRGGAGVWYDCGQSIELFDYVPMQDVRLTMLESHAKTKSIKQTYLTPWEQQLIPLLAARLGLRRYHLLHPSLMYRHFRDWWQSKIGLQTCVESLRFAPVPVPFVPPSLNLPESYIAVKFYVRPTWEASDELHQWAEDLVDRIRQKMPVVLLNTGLHADDHHDFGFKECQSLVGHVTPQNNLAIQSAVLAKAKAFVGTYGGTMQLAARMGVPSAGFYKQFKDTSYSHKLLTDWLGVQQGRPVFVGRPEDASFVAQIIAGIA